MEVLRITWPDERRFRQAVKNKKFVDNEDSDVEYDDARVVEEQEDENENEEEGKEKENPFFDSYNPHITLIDDVPCYDQHSHIVEPLRGVARYFGIPEKWVALLDTYNIRFPRQASEQAFAAQVILLLHLVPNAQSLDLGIMFRVEHCPYEFSFDVFASYIEETNKEKYPAGLLNVEKYPLRPLRLNMLLYFGDGRCSGREPRLGFSDFALVWAFPKLKTILGDKITQYQSLWTRGTINNPPKTSSISELTFYGCNAYGGDLGRVLDILRHLKELYLCWDQFHDGDFDDVDDKCPKFAPTDLGRGLLAVEDTLESFTFVCEADLDREDHDFEEGETIGSLADFTVLKNLSMEIDYLIGRSEETRERTLAQTLPKSIETLGLMCYGVSSDADYEEVLKRQFAELLDSNIGFNKLRHVSISTGSYYKEELELLEKSYKAAGVILEVT